MENSHPIYACIKIKACGFERKGDIGNYLMREPLLQVPLHPAIVIPSTLLGLPTSTKKWMPLKLVQQLTKPTDLSLEKITEIQKQTLNIISDRYEIIDQNTAKKNKPDGDKKKSQYFLMGPKYGYVYQIDLTEETVKDLEGKAKALFMTASIDRRMKHNGEKIVEDIIDLWKSYGLFIDEYKEFEKCEHCNELHEGKLYSGAVKTEATIYLIKQLTIEDIIPGNGKHIDHLRQTCPIEDIKKIMLSKIKEQ